MTDVQKVENYLSALERSLGNAEPGRRAEIILEVRSKIQALQAQGRTVEEALNTIGPVKSVVHDFGLKVSYRRSALSAVLKSILIAFLLLIVAVAIGAGALYWGFRHMTRMGDLHTDVSIFGDDWHEDMNKYLEEEGRLEVEKDVDALKISKLKFNFSAGKIRFAGTNTRKLSWKCKGYGFPSDDQSRQDGDTVVVDLSKTKSAKCWVQIPDGFSLVAEGADGQVQLRAPGFSTDLTLINGQVMFEPDEKKAYKLNFKVQNGRVGEFRSSDTPEALPIKITITNGSIGSGEE